MALNPRDRGTTTGTSRYDPRGNPWRWAAYVIGVILVALVLLWLGGVFDGATDTATTPTTTRGDAAAPAAPAPLAPALPQ